MKERRGGAFRITGEAVSIFIMGHNSGTCCNPISAMTLHQPHKENFRIDHNGTVERVEGG